MFCPKCGKEIPDQVKSCPRCGAVLTGGTSGAAPDTSTPSAQQASVPQGRSAAATAVKSTKKRRNKGGSELEGKQKGKSKKVLIAAAVIIAALFVLASLGSSPEADTSGRSGPNGTAARYR